MVRNWGLLAIANTKLPAMRVNHLENRSFTSCQAFRWLYFQLPYWPKRFLYGILRKKSHNLQKMLPYKSSNKQNSTVSETVNVCVMKCEERKKWMTSERMEQREEGCILSSVERRKLEDWLKGNRYLSISMNLYNIRVMCKLQEEIIISE